MNGDTLFAVGKDICVKKHGHTIRTISLNSPDNVIWDFAIDKLGNYVFCN
jgi:hypothetical protein